MSLTRFAGWIVAFLCLAIGFDNLRLAARGSSNSVAMNIASILSAQVPRGPSGRLEEVRGSSRSGAREAIVLRDTTNGALVIMVSATCPNTIASMPAYRTAASAAERSGRLVVWLSRDSLIEAVGSALFSDLPGRFLSEPPYDTWMRLGLADVPVALLVDRTGLIKRVWFGRLQESDAPSLVLAAAQSS